MYIQENPSVDCVVMEYYVDDLEVAQEYLESNSCKVIMWKEREKTVT
jgi:hypothetical protein